MVVQSAYQLSFETRVWQHETNKETNPENIRQSEKAMKKLQNNFTTPKQSKRLLELGVPRGSADEYRDQKGYRHSLEGILDVELFFQNFPDHLPCWSVGRLMEIIDICEIDPKDEEYPTTKMIKDETKMDYIDYLVGTVRMMSPRLDFSKLEE